MTSITSTQTHHAMTSPRERLQKELESEISSGTIQAGDGTALASALDQIDQALQASRPTGGSAQSAPPKPEEMQAKIDDLIDGQVDDGSLTSDQADALKQLFANAAPKGGPVGPGGPPPPDGEADTASASSSDSSKTDIAKLLEDFLKQLQDKKTETTGYGTTGTTTASSAAALVLDTTA